MNPVTHHPNVVCPNQIDGMVILARRLQATALALLAPLVIHPKHTKWPLEAVYAGRDNTLHLDLIVYLGGCP
jgi:hypothetical protein